MSWEKHTENYMDELGNEKQHVLVFNGHGQALIFVDLEPDSIKTQEDWFKYDHMTVDSHDSLGALYKLLTS